MTDTDTRVLDSDARSVSGPNEGWQDTATSSWQYLDLSDATNRYVRLKCKTADILVCFVPNQSTTPSTADTGDAKAENLAMPLDADEVDQFVVPPSCPHLAFKEASSGGVLHVQIV